MNGASRGPVGSEGAPHLIGRLVNDVSELIDKQVELAKQEIREDLGALLGAAKTLAIGAGIAVVAALFLLATVWTGIIWFFNWAGWNLLGADWLGWPIGLLVPAAIAFLAWKAFIRVGLRQLKIKPLKRTRATLKEDAEWVQRLRTLSAK